MTQSIKAQPLVLVADPRVKLAREACREAFTSTSAFHLATHTNVGAPQRLGGFPLQGFSPAAGQWVARAATAKARRQPLPPVPPELGPELVLLGNYAQEDFITEAGHDSCMEQLHAETALAAWSWAGAYAAGGDDMRRLQAAVAQWTVEHFADVARTSAFARLRADPGAHRELLVAMVEVLSARKFAALSACRSAVIYLIDAGMPVSMAELTARACEMGETGVLAALARRDSAAVRNALARGDWQAAVMAAGSGSAATMRWVLDLVQAAAHPALLRAGNCAALRAAVAQKDLVTTQLLLAVAPPALQYEMIWAAGSDSIRQATAAGAPEISHALLLPLTHIARRTLVRGPVFGQMWDVVAAGTLQEASFWLRRASQGAMPVVELLAIAAGFGQVGAVSWWLDQAPADAQEGLAQYALYLAARQAQPAVVEMLCKRLGPDAQCVAAAALEDLSTTFERLDDARVRQTLLDAHPRRDKPDLVTALRAFPRRLCEAIEANDVDSVTRLWRQAQASVGRRDDVADIAAAHATRVATPGTQLAVLKLLSEAQRVQFLQTVDAPQDGLCSNSREVIDFLLPVWRAHQVGALGTALDFFYLGINQGNRAAIEAWWQEAPAAHRAAYVTPMSLRAMLYARPGLYGVLLDLDPAITTTLLHNHAETLMDDVASSGDADAFKALWDRADEPTRASLLRDCGERFAAAVAQHRSELATALWAKMDTSAQTATLRDQPFLLGDAAGNGDLVLFDWLVAMHSTLGVGVDPERTYDAWQNAAATGQVGALQAVWDTFDAVARSDVWQRFLRDEHTEPFSYNTVPGSMWIVAQAIRDGVMLPTGWLSRVAWQARCLGYEPLLRAEGVER